MRIVVALAELGRDEQDALAMAMSIAGADVVALTVGPEASSSVFRHPAVAAAARRVRVEVESLALMDFHGVGEVIAAAVQNLGADLLLCGARSQEEGLGAVPAAAARYLAAPVLACADDVSAAEDPGRVLCTVRGGGRQRRMSVRLPAVISVLRSVPAGAPPAPPASDQGDVAVELMSLSELGLQEARLRRRDDLLGWMQAAGRERAVVRTLPELLALLES